MKLFVYLLCLLPLTSMGYYSFGDFNDWSNEEIEQPMQVIGDHYLFEFESVGHNNKAFHDILFININDVVYWVTTQQNKSKHKGMFLFTNGVYESGKMVFPSNGGDIIYSPLSPSETSSRYWFNDGVLSVTFALDKSWFESLPNWQGTFSIAHISGNGVSPYNKNNFKVDSLVLIPELSSIYYVFGFFTLIGLRNLLTRKRKL